MRAVIRRVRRDETGLSMAEVLVGMLLTSLILVVVTTMFVNVTKLTTQASQNRSSTGSAANIANTITSAVSAAAPQAISGGSNPAIAAGTRDFLQIYSLYASDGINPAPTRVSFWIANVPATATAPAFYELRQSTCAGTVSGGYYVYTGCPVYTNPPYRVLGTNILMPSSTANQLFTYLDASGVPITLATPTTTLLPAQRESVASIIVTVRTQQPDKDTSNRAVNVAPAVIVSNTVVLRNLGLETEE